MWVVKCQKQFNNQHFLFLKPPVSGDHVVNKKSSLLIIEKITTCPELLISTEWVLCSRVYSFWSCLFISEINFLMGFSETKERDDKVWCGSKNFNSVCCWYLLLVPFKVFPSFLFKAASLVYIFGHLERISKLDVSYRPAVILPWNHRHN